MGSRVHRHLLACLGRLRQRRAGGQVRRGWQPAGDRAAGVSLAFGLTVLTGAYALGHISGGHFNPAVSLGLWAGGRFPARDLPGYVIAQVLGGIAAGALLYFIASGNGTAIGQTVVGDTATAGAFASNGYDSLTPGGYAMGAALACES